jgi:hypothetical protein
VQGEIRQLVEVKLNVVQAAPASSHALPSDGVIDVEANEIKDSEDKTSSLLDRSASDAK